ncbi:MAG: polyprenol phosphomannose-dependent alpha 1,6 mannosyltransferase MptB [Oscillochloris sp.]|nr:polyprenol phosphomannose-dependent alpha 1,6 mannosyltransferase MptB [Oscillochloris sp.]
MQLRKPANPSRAALSPAVARSAAPSRFGPAGPQRVTQIRPAGLRRLLLYGLGMFVALGYFVWRYPLLGNSQRLTDIGKLSNYSWTGCAGFLLSVAVLFGLYGLALRESRHLPDAQAIPIVFGCAVAMALLMVAMYPVAAIDIFIYAVRSHLLTAYGANPSAALPRDFAPDPWVPFASQEWGRYSSPYGPLWNQIAAPITALAGNNMLAALIGFKLLSVVAMLGSAWIIVVMLRPHNTPVFGALFFLWNPLVLWEAVGNGHNDVIMLVPILLALLAWLRRRDSYVLPLLVAATLIKYVSVLLLPLAAVALWQRAETRVARWRIVTLSLVLSGLLVLIALYPFYDLAALYAAFKSQSNFMSFSLAAVVVESLHILFGISKELSKPWVRFPLICLVLAVVGWQTWVLWRRRSSLNRAVFESMYILLLLGIWSWRPWYLVWLVGLAALLPQSWPAWRTLLWTVCAMPALAISIWIAKWWNPGLPTIQLISVPLVLAATLTLTVMEVLRRRKQLTGTPMTVDEVVRAIQPPPTSWQ